MRREEKRRKFNEAVLNTLFPPPPSPPSPPPKDEDVPFNVSCQDDIELETGSSATSCDEEGETQKLTRAQRKRMRKKKLKEDASRRKQIIGPLLPSTIGEGENCTPDVRRNASEKPGNDPPQAGTPGSSNQKNKVKERRKAKKLAREREQR